MAKFTDNPNENPNENNEASGGIFVEPLSIDIDGSDYENVVGEGFPGTFLDRHVRFFHCCCDFRKAVMLVNGLTVAWELIALVGLLYEFSFVYQFKDMIDEALDSGLSGNIGDDAFNTGGLDQLPTLDDVADVVGMIEAMFGVFFFVAIGLNASGIYGALYYKEWGVITAGMVYFVRLVLALIVLIYIDTAKWNLTKYTVGKVLIICLQLYPHVFLVRQMRTGIMTPSNYHKVKQCCCC